MPLGSDDEVAAGGQDAIDVVRKSPLASAPFRRRRIPRTATRSRAAVVADHRLGIGGVPSTKPVEQLFVPAAYDDDASHGSAEGARRVPHGEARRDANLRLFQARR